MGILNPNILQYRNGSGEVYSGSKLYTYVSETYVPKRVYLDKNLTSPAPNPVIADADGYFPQFFSEGGAYRIVLKDKDDVELAIRDNLVSESDGLDIPENASFLGTDNSGAIIDTSSNVIPIITEQVISQTGYIGSFASKSDLDLVTGIDGQWASVADTQYGRIVYWWNVSTSEWVRRAVGITTKDPLQVRWIDADGTILKQEWVRYGGTSTTPDDPNLNDKLTFDGWTTDGSYITRDRDIIALYHPTDNWNHYGITTSADNVSEVFTLTKSDSALLTIDFGDGTSASTTSAGRCNFTHTWASSGSYDVRIKQPLANTIWSEGYSASVGLLTYNKQALTHIWFQKDRMTQSSQSGYSSQYAFSYCDELSYVIAPVNLSFWISSFQYCNSLICFTDTGTTSAASALLNFATGLRYGVFTKLSNYVETYLLGRCHNLESVYMPALSSTTVTEPFKDCNKLRIVEVPTLTGSYINETHSIKYGYFPSLKTTGSSFMNYSYNLRSVYAPILSATGQSSFKHCYNLQEVTLDSLSSIGDISFSYTKLTSAYLPSSVTFGSNSFSYNSIMQSIDLGPGTTTLAAGFCVQNPILKTVIVRATTPPSMSSGCFVGSDPTLKIYVPENSVSSYKTATNWAAFASQIEAL